MWVSRNHLKLLYRVNDDLQRRVKRLELILMRDAQNKIASLKDDEAGSILSDGVLTIEEILKK